MSDGADLVRTPDDLPVSPKGSEGAAGRVLVRIGYSIRAANADAFMAALNALGRSRRRNGARLWRARMQGPDAEGHIAVVETYLVDTLDEWIRFGDRRVLGDHQLESAVRVLHVGDTNPRVTIRRFR